MTRAFWFVAGAATGVYGVLRAKRVLYQFTPDGLAGRAAALTVGARMFADEVGAGMAEREQQLRGTVGASSGTAQMIEQHSNQQHSNQQHSTEEHSTEEPGNEEHGNDGNR